MLPICFVMETTLRKRRCLWCPIRFVPQHRLGCRQRSCGGAACKRKQKRLSQHRWQKKDRADYQQAQRDWRGKRPDYWQSYRSEHPDYVARNRIQSRIRWLESQRTLQKRIDILEVTEKTMEYWNLTHFAKRPRSLFPLTWAYTVPHGLARDLKFHSP